jgi:hypothetical protein
MHEPEHLDLATIGAVGNAIEAQRAGCRSAALVKRGDETILAGEICAVILSLAMIVILVLRRVRSEQRARRRLIALKPAKGFYPFTFQLTNLIH